LGTKKNYFFLAKTMVIIKEIFKELTLGSSFHGLPNIVRTKRVFNKIIWFLCTLGSTVVCSLLAIQIMINYLAFKPITRLETVFEQPAQFFSVQICSNDRQTFNNRPLNDLIRQCEFNYDRSCFLEPDQYFYSYDDPSYNTCFRFNSGKNKSGHSVSLLNSTIGGKDDSFVLEIYAPRGLQIWIHNYTLPPKRQYKVKEIYF